MSRYFVVPAPGYYGDIARVVSSHGSLAAAWRAAGSSGTLTIREGALQRGERWYRSSEAIYPIASREGRS